MIRSATMTKGIDRKVLQRVRSESDQNERLLGRAITTALAACGTLVGWMLLSQSTHTTTVQSTEVTIDEFAPVAVHDVPDPIALPTNVQFAPIPTLPTMPDLLPVPTLMPYVAQPMSANPVDAPNNMTDMQVAGSAQNSGAPASDMPVLQVVVQPTALVLRIVPKPAAPQPAQQRPNPGGNSGGSN